jgi:hypothetical protein
MQVKIDYTNVIDENNELDNSAVRPFVNGNYQVAGRIIVQSAVSPPTSYSEQYQYLQLYGRAWYTDLAVQLTDSTVAGATVEFTITETGATYTGYTNSWGYINIYFPAPVTPGVYHITGSVTDFTLTRDFTNEFTILPKVIPETKPNLTINYCHSVDVQPVNPHTGANVTLVAHVTNNGNATAIAPIEVRFTYSTGETWLGTYAGNLNAGQSVNVSVTATTPPTTSTVLTALVDPSNTIAEWNESFGDNSAIDNMCYDFQPVGICGGNFWGTRCVNSSTGIYVGVNSYHLYDASPLQVLFEVSGPGISGWQNLGIGTLNNVTKNCYCPYVVGLPDPFTFAEVGLYTFRMTVDPNNVYPECSEANNVLVVTVNSVTCLPPETKPNLAFTYCYGLQVTPVNPFFPGMANLVANVTNNGNATAVGPIDVQFTYSEGTFTGSYNGNLTPGQSVAVSVPAPLPVPATTILTAIIDPANTVVEWNETDNTASDNMCWEFQPVPHCGTNFWSRTYLVGQSVSLSVGLNVSHLYDANPAKVKFEVSGPGIAGVVNLGNGLLNNATRNCWCPWGVSLPSPFTFFEAGTYHFKMTADPDNIYTECDETNNILEVDVVVMNGADMRILSQFINPEFLNPGVGDSVSLIVSYENIGNSNVDDIMKLRVNVDEVFLSDVYPVSGLATGDHASIAIPHKWASSIPGAHVIRAIIDYDHQIPEINESNNEATRAIIVGESANLYFQLFAASNNNPATGDYIHIDARIGNNGDVDATANVKFYYINDSGDTIPAGQTPISVLAHDSITILMPWVVLDNSTTLIGKIVDVNVQEFNPDDNVATDVLGGFDVTLTATPACYKMNNGTLTAHVSGGTAPYLYAWNNGASGATLTGYAGDYTVTVTDNTGLNMVVTGTIVNAPDLNPVISGPSTVCLNSTGNVYSTEAGMTAYSWSVSAGGTITAGGSASSNSVTVTWNTPGAQHVSVNYTTQNGCTATSATEYNVSVLALPVATITGSDTAYVFASGNVYHTQGAMSGYAWTLSAGGTITSRADTNEITVTWSTIGPKTVSVVYTDGHGCTSLPAVLQLTVLSLPVPTIIGNTSICGIPSPDNIYTTETGMTNYVWNVSAGGLITAGDGTNAITVEWTTAGAQWVTVTYMDSFGNSPIVPTVKNVTVEAIPVPTITGPALICGFPSAGNVYTTEAGMANYSWTVSADGTITSGLGSNSITVTWNAAGSQSVSVTYTTVNQCPAAAPAIYPVTVYPFNPATINGPTSICGIPSLYNSYSTEEGMSNYVWNVSSGGTIVGSDSTHSILVDWTTAGAKTVSVNYINAQGCSPANGVVLNVNVYALPVPVISGPETVCGVPSSDNVYSTAAGMTAYSWHVSAGGSITGGLGTNAITVNWTSLGNQTVDVNYTDTHGCTAGNATVKNVNVTVIVPVYLSIAASDDTVCSGSSVTFTATAINGGASPVYQWKVNGLNAGWNSPTYTYVPVQNDSVTCMVTSSLSCAANNVAVSNFIKMTVYPHPNPPLSGGNQTVCSNALPGTLSATPPEGSTVDWYYYASGGNPMLANSSTLAISSAGNYYAESRNLITGCRSSSRTLVSLTITPAVLYFIDLDGDGYGNPDVTLYACTQPQGYVLNGLDCNDNNPNISPLAQHIEYTGNAGFTSSIVSPAVGSSYTLFHFEADYFDATNALPGTGYPRLILDYEGNGGYTDPNDRVIIMTASDPTDINTTDGKRYFAEVNGLTYGANWKSRIVINGTGNCSTNFGPFDCPDVLHEPNIYLFANDISFSVPHPTVSQNINVYSVVHNESDFDAQNFVCHLVNQWDTLIAYPDVLVANLPAHSTTTVSWNITTPAEPAWCPMQVTIDYTNVIAENNELDNSAVRPFVNGNYQVAGKIVVQADVSPVNSYSNQYSYLTLYGRAWYTDLAVQLTDTSVAGATVDFFITETGQTYTGYTNSAGYYSISFPAPDSVATYHITASVTDFTLTGTDTTHFRILPPVIPETRPNLTLNNCHSVDVQPVNPHSQQNVTLVAHVVNSGNALATGPIVVLFTYSSGGSWLGQYNGNLAPGQSVNVTAVAPLPAIGALLTAYVDPANTVFEWSESDNSSADNMCYDFQPVPICGSNFWGTHCVNSTTGIYIGLNVSHLYDASLVDVKFEVSGPGINGWQTLGTGRLANATRNCYCPYVVSIPDQFAFAEIGVYTFRMTVDPDNMYPECDEGNNELVVTVNSVECLPPPPPEIRPNLAFVGCTGLQVAPVNPMFPGMATLKATIVNNGNATAIGPINVDFTYSGGTFTGTFPGNMSAGQSAIVSVTAPLPVPATTTLTAVIDPADAIFEWSEADNATSDNMCWEFQPVPHCGTNFWSRTYLAGQTATLSVGLNVQNLYEANPVKVRFEVSGPGITGTQNLGNALLNNASRNCYCPWGVVLPMPYTFFEPGVYHFTMTADPDNDYTECNENNNILEVDVVVIQGADMRILSQYINPDPLNPGVGDSVSYIISYENIGNSNVNDVMKLKVIADNTILDEIYPVSGLAYGDHASIAIPTKWASNLPGAHVIRAIIDADNQVPELNEMNNEATRAIIVGECANLHFVSFAPSKSNPALQEYIHINSVIGNNGDVNATANVKFYYLTDGGDTIPIGQTPVSVFAHTSVPLTMPWVVADNSTTIIGKIVDVNVQEFNPDDNMATALIGGFEVSIAATSACYKVNNGTLTANVTGGTAPFLYVWSNGYIGQTLTAGAGNYSVTVTDNVGVSVITTGIITEYPTVIPVITGPSTTIINAPGNVYTTEAGMTAYTWTVTGGSVTAGGTSGSNSITVTWTSLGLQSLSVNYTDGHGRMGNSASIFRVMVYDVTAPTISGPDTVCENTAGNQYLTESGMTAYIWTVSAGGTITGGGTSSSNFVDVTWTTAGARSVSVSYTDQNGSVPVYPTVFPVTVHPQPVPTITGPVAACVNAVGNIYSTEPGMTGYMWTVSAGGTVTGGGTSNSNFVVVTWTTAGAKTVSVSYTNGFGCNAASPTVYQVTANPLPAAVAGANRGICVNSSTTIGAAAVTGNTYSWTSRPTGYTSALANPTVTPLVTTTYRLVETVTATGCNKTDSVTVTVNPLPVPTLIGPSPVCVNSIGNTYTTEASMTNYLWTIPAGATVTAGGTAASNFVTITWLTAGTKVIKVNYTNGNNCTAVNAKSLNVTVNPLPVPLLLGNSTACANTNTVYNTASGQLNYVWVLSAGGTIVSGQGTKTATVRWANAGANWISINYTNIGGCSALTPTVKNVTVNPTPVPTLTGTATVCANTTGNIYTTEAGKTAYSWVVSAGGIITAGGTTASNSVTVTWATAGAKTVSVTYANSFGCIATPTVFNVTVNPLPAAIVGANRAVCSNTSTTLGAAAVSGNTYSWTSRPAGFTSALANPTVTPLVTTTYKLVETVAATGCNKTDSVEIVVNPVPVVTLTGPTPVCLNTTGNTYTTEASMTNYLWTIPAGGTVTAGGSTSDNYVTITWTSAGTKALKVNYTNATNCTAAAPKQFNVVVNPLPVPLLIGSSTCCVNVNTTYNTASGQSNYNWTTDGIIVSGQGTKTVVVKWIISGTHYIAINYTNIGGCSATAPTIKNVTVNTCKSAGIEPSPISADFNPLIIDSESVDLGTYPNPSNGYFTAVISSPKTATYNLQLFSNLGVKVFELKDITVTGVMQQSIDIRDVANGVYTLVLTNKDLSVKRKVVVRK